MTLDLEHRLEAEAALGKRLHRRPGEDEIARPAAGLVAAAGVHSPHQLGIEPDPRGEAEAAPVRAAERDSPGVPAASLRAASTGSRGSPSTRGRTLVPPPGTKPSGTRPSLPFNASLKPPSPEKT